MGRQAKLVEIKETLIYLKNRIRKEKNPRLRIRIQMLILFKGEQLSQDIVALRLGLGKRSISRWLNSYKLEGLENLLKIKSGGKRHSTITSEMHELLKEKLHDSFNPLQGYKDAVLWLEKTHGTRVPYTTLYSYLKRNFGSKLKTPRKSHYKKSEAAIEVFKKNYRRNSNILERI